MKQTTTILISFLLSFSLFSQEDIPEITIGDDFFEESQKIDTLYIYAGEPHVLLIDVDENSAFNSVDKREEKELLKNFEKDAFKITNIKKYTYVFFENKQTIDVSEFGSSFEAYVYWSGNKDDRLQVQEGLGRATEFVAKHMGVYKESSYIVDARKHKKEINLLKNKNNITAKSKAVMNAFINDFVHPIHKYSSKDASLFKQNIPKLRHIETFFEKKDGTKKPLKNIYFHKNGHPYLVETFDRNGIQEAEYSFKYQNEMLTQIIDKNKTTYLTYDDNKIGIHRNMGDANETTIARLENNILIKNRYILMIDDTYADQNSFLEEVIDDDCTLSYYNNEISSKTCNSNPEIFPFTSERISYENEQVTHISKFKIEKKGEGIFKKYYSTNGGDYKLSSTFQLNNQNLVGSVIFTKEGINLLKIEYTYYP